MITYSSILGVLAIEGLIKSYLIPKAIDKYKLDETGTFFTLLALLFVFAIFEFFIYSKCIDSESLNHILGDNPAAQIMLLFLVALIVNYRWVMAIYNKYTFWPTLGILSLVSFVNEFNNLIIRKSLLTLTGTECSY